MRLQFWLKPARSDGDIGAGPNRGEKLGCLFDRRGQVGIAEEKNLAARVQHAVAHAVSLAAIARIFEQPERRMRLGIPADEVRSLVARSVIDDNDLCIPALSRDVVQHSVKSCAETSPF